MKRILIAFLLTAAMFNAATAQQLSLPPARPATTGVSGTVTLALTEYNRLVDLARATTRPPEPAPLSSILSRASLRLRAEGELVVGSLDVQGELLRAETTRVPVVTGLTVLDATQGQRALPIVSDDSVYSAVLNNAGPFSISMNVAAAVKIDAGKAEFSLNVPSAGTALLSLEVPGLQSNVKIEPGLITNRASANGKTTIEATLQPGKAVRISWTTRDTTLPPPREVRFLSDVKGMITISEAEQRVSALCDVTIIQGEPNEFKLTLPIGFELIEASGATLESGEIQGNEIVLKVREPLRRNHQFLVVIERASRDTKLDAPFLNISGSQRETGEILIEAAGAIEMTSTEGGVLRRIDVRETNAISRSLARFPVHAAFRYHRRTGDTPTLSLSWNQFPDAPVIAAIADRATVTTLVNVEGKTLTEVMLRVRNHSQAFLKIDLPVGASLLSAEVGGVKVKPVLAPDGSRVPLLRTGFRPNGPYDVSFVYLSSVPAFSKRGDCQLNLPKMDIPVSLVEWELFVPDRLNVLKFAGNAISTLRLPQEIPGGINAVDEEANEDEILPSTQSAMGFVNVEAGQIGGIVADQLGAVVEKATVTATSSRTGTKRVVTTNDTGGFVFSNLQSGPYEVKIEAPGFKPTVLQVNLDPNKPTQMGVTLNVSAATETVTVTAGDESSLKREYQQLRSNLEPQVNAPSNNVVNFQRKVAGILPLQIEVPRAGKSYRFIRPLVMDEETTVSFNYKSK